MCEIEISEQLDGIFAKLAKKNRAQLILIEKKMIQIKTNPYHFKPLRSNMKGLRRVHVNTSFVLTYEIIENLKVIRFLDYNHHDSVYKE